jgi:hypothetical protein
VKFIPKLTEAILERVEMFIARRRERKGKRRAKRFAG